MGRTIEIATGHLAKRRTTTPATRPKIRRRHNPRSKTCHCCQSV